MVQRRKQGQVFCFWVVFENLRLEWSQSQELSVSTHKACKIFRQTVPLVDGCFVWHYQFLWYALLRASSSVFNWMELSWGWLEFTGDLVKEAGFSHFLYAFWKCTHTYTNTHTLARQACCFFLMATSQRQQQAFVSCSSSWIWGSPFQFLLGKIMHQCTQVGRWGTWHFLSSTSPIPLPYTSMLPLILWGIQSLSASSWEYWPSSAGLRIYFLNMNDRRCDKEVKKQNALTNRSYQRH